MIPQWLPKNVVLGTFGVVFWWGGPRATWYQGAKDRGTKKQRLLKQRKVEQGTKELYRRHKESFR